MSFLRDTDHVTIIQKGSGSDYANIARQISLHASLGMAFSIVSFHEQTRGAHTFINRANNSAGLVRG